MSVGGQGIRCRTTGVRHRVCRLEGEGTDERRQGHRVCLLEGKGSDAGRQEYARGMSVGRRGGRCRTTGVRHRVCRLEGKGTDAGQQGYVTGYVGWKARDLMQDDRSASQGMSVGRRGGRCRTTGVRHRVCRLEGKGTDAGRQGYVTGYVGWKVRELMQDHRGTSQGMSVGRRGD